MMTINANTDLKCRKLNTLCIHIIRTLLLKSTYRNGIWIFLSRKWGEQTKTRRKTGWQSQQVHRRACRFSSLEKQQVEDTLPGVLREDLWSPVRQWKRLGRSGWQAESRAGVQEDNESMDRMGVIEKVRQL